MTHYKKISELIKDKNNYPNAGQIWIQKSKINDLENAEYWIMSSEEEGELPFRIGENGSTIPEPIFDFGVKSFLDVGTFQDIIDNKLEHNPDLSLDNLSVFIEAIVYYLENDDFLD